MGAVLGINKALIRTGALTLLIAVGLFAASIPAVALADGGNPGESYREMYPEFFPPYKSGDPIVPEWGNIVVITDHDYPSGNDNGEELEKAEVKPVDGVPVPDDQASSGASQQDGSPAPVNSGKPNQPFSGRW